MAGDLISGTGRRRRFAAGALVVLVTAAHLGLSDRWLADRWGERAGGGDGAPRRIEVAFVRELLPIAPPAAADGAAAPAPRPRPARSRPVPARPQAASAPRETLAPATVDIQPAQPPSALPASAAEVAPTIEAAVVSAAIDSGATRPGEPPAAPATVPAASVPLAPASAAAAGGTGAVAFDWPPSTRLSYLLNGNYRGELQGSATVEWLRTGSRYQVHLEALVGLAVAPLMARRIHSDGELTEAGLAPRRFDGEQRVGFSTRRWSVRFEPDRVVLADGSDAAPVIGVQDEASQFVQLTWLFITRPELLEPGRQVQLPLVLRGRVSQWTYDVVQPQALDLPFGRVDTMHVKPRRPARPGGDMTAELWIAPGLQYLPVRILIRQDDQTFVDLMLARPPLQGADPAPSGAAAR